MRETMVGILSQSGSGVKAQRPARVHRVRPLWNPRATTGFILFLRHKTEVPVVSASAVSTGRQHGAAVSLQRHGALFHEFQYRGVVRLMCWSGVRLIWWRTVQYRRVSGRMFPQYSTVEGRDIDER